jgi:hypothetical protein
MTESNHKTRECHIKNTSVVTKVFQEKSFLQWAEATQINPRPVSTWFNISSQKDWSLADLS